MMSRRRYTHLSSAFYGVPTSKATGLVLGGIILASGASAFFAPACCATPRTFVATGWSIAAIRASRQSSSCLDRRDLCHQCHSNYRNVNLRGVAGLAMVSSSSSEQEKVVQGRGPEGGAGEGGTRRVVDKMDAGREYGMPKEPSVELVRLDLAEVPVSSRICCE